MGKLKFPKEHPAVMKDFPEFMKQPVNRIATSSQATPGVEGLCV